MFFRSRRNYLSVDFVVSRDTCYQIIYIIKNLIHRGKLYSKQKILFLIIPNKKDIYKIVRLTDWVMDGELIVIH